jgi:imidazolonepropionase-like amidohydrolase
METSFSSRRLAALGVGLASLLLQAGNSVRAAESPAPNVTILHCPAFIDTVAGKHQGKTSIVISGDRVQKLAPDFIAQDGANIIELPGQTCMPGLIDAHTHVSSQITPTIYSDMLHKHEATWTLRSTVWAKRTLMAGFTTIRNLGDDHYETGALRDAIAEGWVVGPRIYTAGPAIGTTGGHADDTDGLRYDLQKHPGQDPTIVNGPDAMWTAVREHFKQGANVIKIMTTGGVLDLGGNADHVEMTVDEAKAVVAAAHDYGLTVAVHAHNAEGIRRAIVAGVDSIEHGTYMDDADIKLMKEHGTYYVPTIYTGIYIAEFAKVPGRLPPQVAAKALEIGPHMFSTLGKAIKSGVKIAYGTDAGVYPHGDNWKDFPLLVKAGMTPMEAIQSATLNAAKLLRKDKDLGAIEPGKLADVVTVPGNPLDDIELMGKVGFVMKAGQIYKEDGKAVDHPVTN